MQAYTKVALLKLCPFKWPSRIVLENPKITRKTTLFMASYMINEKPINRSSNSRTLIMKCFVCFFTQKLVAFEGFEGMKNNEFTHKV